MIATTGTSTFVLKLKPRCGDVSFMCQYSSPRADLPASNTTATM
jgi:hypothetical protein